MNTSSRKIVSIFWLLVTLFSFSAWGTIQVDSRDLKFVLMANDGSFFHSCSHTLESAEMNDWKVQCGPRQFTVHFLLREFTRKVAPMKTFEVLYFITGQSQSSQGVWIDLETVTNLQGLTFHQSIDNDASDLALYFRPQR